MKLKLLIASALLTVGIGLQAASLDIVDVSAPAINCVFDTNCTVTVTDSTDTFTLAGTTGIGVLQTRTYTGQPGAAAAGLTAYEYRIDLSSVMNKAPEPCPEVCVTNRVPIATNMVVTCRTNSIIGFTNIVCLSNLLSGPFNCVTNANGVVFCRTNLPCFTNANGLVFCPTNDVFCVTNSKPSSESIVCRTNRRIEYTNVVVCRPGNCPTREPACVRSLVVDFGTVVSNLDYNANAILGEQVFVVTSNAVGSVAPLAAIQTGRQIEFVFGSNAVCAGESSFFFGLVSSNVPRPSVAALGDSSGRVQRLDVRTPSRPPVDQDCMSCDLQALRDAIKKIPESCLHAKDSKHGDARRRVLLNLLDAAQRFADSCKSKQALKMLELLQDKLSDRACAGEVDKIAPLIQTAKDCLRHSSKLGKPEMEKSRKE